MIWMVHVAISLGVGFFLQARPELPASPWFYTPDWAGNLAHWDVLWEARIADQGYGPDFFPQTSSKFPLMAMAARGLHLAFGTPIQIGLFIVNKAGLLAGLWALWRLIERMNGREYAALAVGYVAFPLVGTAYMYWMSYPDVLFLAWWALAFADFFDGRYYRAGLWTTLAAWTRPQGAVLIGVFGLAIVVRGLKSHPLPPSPSPLRNEGENKGGIVTRLIMTCAMPIVGLIVWVVRVSDVTGIPFSPYVAQVDSGRGDLMWPWERLTLRVNGMVANSSDLYAGIWLEAWQLALILFGLGILVYACWRGRLRWELVVFSIISIFLPLLTRIMAIGRFSTMTLLPVALVYLIPTRWKTLHLLIWIVGLGLSLFVMAGLNLFPRELAYVP
jgi:hypothetical protein